ncbi:MAG: hypothetical protein SVX43_15405, partial [Cyanobacteriota bacterium]|nr:hypothetical protein [Cyanobacteriota bacterium]
MSNKQGEIIMANFNFDEVWSNTLNNASKTRIVTMNGIFTTSDSFYGEFVPHVNQHFFIGNNEVDSNLGSLKFDPVYNPSVIDSGEEIASSLAEFFGKYLLAKAIEDLNPLDFIQNAGDFFDLVWQFASNPTPSIFSDDQFTAQLISFIASQIPLVSELPTIIDSLPDDFDLKEALQQYWYPNSVPPSQELNNTWIDTDFLNQNQNSLIVIGHSQGNFFLEDALIDMGSVYTPQIKVISFGSPTSYA